MVIDNNRELLQWLKNNNLVLGMYLLIMHAYYIYISYQLSSPRIIYHYVSIIYIDDYRIVHLVGV